MQETLGINGGGRHNVGAVGIALAIEQNGTRGLGIGDGPKIGPVNGVCR